MPREHTTVRHIRGNITDPDFHDIIGKACSDLSAEFSQLAKKLEEEMEKYQNTAGG